MYLQTIHITYRCSGICINMYSVSLTFSFGMFFHHLPHVTGGLRFGATAQLQQDNSVAIQVRLFQQLIIQLVAPQATHNCLYKVVCRYKYNVQN